MRKDKNMSFQRIVCLVCLVVYAALTSTVSFAAEPALSKSTVSFPVDGRRVVGTLTVPNGITSPPIVLILHGMGGDRHGPRIRRVGDTLFERTARVLAGSGFASLRISTGGRGGSEGSFLDMTLERRIQEALGAIDWIADQGRFDRTKISVLGHSQGTLIAITAAARAVLPAGINAVVLWAPQTNALDTYRGSMGAAIYRKGLAAGPDEIVQWRGIGGTTRAFRRDFFRGLAELDTLADVENFDGRLLVVTGNRDAWSTYGAAQVLSAHHPGETTYLQFDVGHRMGGQIGAAAVEAVAKGTVLWLLGDM